MTKLPHVIVFGVLEKAFVVASDGNESLIPVNPKCCRALITVLNENSIMELHGHIYLRLESIIGDHPTMLNVYLGLPDGAKPADHPENLGGSIGLYGLRQASEKLENGEGGQGLGFSLDVSQIFKGLRLAGPPAPATIRVTVVPYRPIPEQARITIGKMSFFHVF